MTTINARRVAEVTATLICFFATGNSASAQEWETNGSDIYNANSGNVGIGTTDPESKLHVNGDLALGVARNLWGYGISFGQGVVQPQSHNLAMSYNSYRRGSDGQFTTMGRSDIYAIRMGDWAGGGARSGMGFYADANVPPAGSVFSPTLRMLLTNTGLFGIGTTAPQYPLHIYAEEEGGVAVDAPNDGISGVGFLKDGDKKWGVAVPPQSGDLVFYNDHLETSSVVFAENGSVGIGTQAPQYPLHIYAEGEGGAVFDAPDSGISGVGFLKDGNKKWGVAVPPQSGDLVFFSDYLGHAPVVFTDDGSVGIGTSAPEAELHVVGTTQTDVLVIEGGSDLAEPFDIAEGDEVQPGMVVSIDPDNPGQLQLSTSAYDRKVAGIVSGAKDIRPGLVMTQEGSIADGDHPVALAGRVYCWVDATKAPVTPGDLLTTAPRRGHAMKVSDFEQAQGATLGKAMTGLKSGTGLVLVLVSLH